MKQRVAKVQVMMTTTMRGVMKVAAVNALSVMSWLPGLVPVVTVSVLLVAPSVWMPENKISLRKLKGKIVFL